MSLIYYLKDQNSLSMKPLKNNLTLFGKKIEFNLKKQEKILKRHGSSRPRLSILGLNHHDLNQFSSQEIRALMSFLPAKDRSKCKPKSWFIITKSNIGKKVFDYIIDVLVWVSTVTSLFYLAFQPELSELAKTIDLIIWFLFVIDFFLNFISEKVNKKGKKELRCKEIFVIYLKTWLVADLLSIIPLRYSGNPNSECFLRQFRLFKCSRLFDRVNIFRLADKLVQLFFKSETKTKKRSRLFIIYLWKLLGYILLIFFSTYCLCCLWIFYVEVINRNMHEKTNFEEDFEISPGFHYSKLIKTWYFVFSTIITVGYGDFYATNKYEMIVAIFFVLSAPTWFAFIVNKTRYVIDDLQEASGKYKKELDDLSIWISQLENSYKRLPIKLKNKINSHFQYYRKNDRLGRLSTIIDSIDNVVIRDEYFNALSMNMKEKIYDYLFNDIFYHFRYFFRYFNKVKYWISGFMQPRFYENEAVILKKDQKVFEITFVNNGKFDIGIFIGKNYVKVYSVRTSFVIGDFFALKQIPSFAQFTSTSKIQAYSIPVNVIDSLKLTCPENVGDYLMSIEKYYKVILDKIASVNDKNFLETDEFGGSGEKFSGFNEDRKNSDWLNKEQRKESVFDEFGKIEKAVDEFKEVRKEKIRMVKEKMVEFICKNRSEFIK